jgi:hypothetical protein
LGYWEFKITSSDYRGSTVDEILGDMSADNNTTNQLPLRSEFFLCQRKQCKQNSLAHLLFTDFQKACNTGANNCTIFLTDFVPTGNKLQKSIHV